MTQFNPNFDPEMTQFNPNFDPQYAAFIAIEPKIIRRSKGNAYTEVNGLLHEADMLDYKPETVMAVGKKIHAFKAPSKVCPGPVTT